jgi:hypothetical protein
MSKSLLRLALLFAPLALTACGEGWEVQRVSDYGAYGNNRTAGTGVAYVRAKMLPKKEIVADFVAEPVMEEIKVEAEVAKPMEEPAPVLAAEEIFTEAQQKGAASEAAVAVEGEGETANIEETEKEVEAVKKESDKLPVKDEKVLTPMPDVEENENKVFDEDHSSYVGESEQKLAAEDYISQAPNNIIAPKVEVIKMSSYEQSNEVQMMKTAGINKSDTDGVEVYENEVVQPQKHIIVPKKDMGSYLSIGEEELHAIYNQPF